MRSPVQCPAICTAADSWDGNSSFGGNSDRGSDGIGGSTMGTSRRGMFAVLRIEDLGVIGEKGTKVHEWSSLPDFRLDRLPSGSGLRLTVSAMCAAA